MFLRLWMCFFDDVVWGRMSSLVTGLNRLVLAFVCDWIASVLPPCPDITDAAKPLELNTVSVTLSTLRIRLGEGRATVALYLLRP
jgi:hypothetical protein